MKAFKEDLNKWNDIPNIWKRALIIVKVSVISKSIYKQNQKAKDLRMEPRNSALEFIFPDKYTHVL